MRSGKIKGTEYCFGLVNLPRNWLFPRSHATVQLVDPSAVYGEKHILVSIYSYLKGLRLAKDKNIDLLLRITGTKQIKQAMKAKPEGRKAVLIVVGAGAKKEFKRFGFLESGDIISRQDELEACERSATVGI